MKKIRELSAEEKWEIDNYLYNYSGANTVDQRIGIRIFLYCYIERLLNEEKTR